MKWSHLEIVSLALLIACGSLTSAEPAQAQSPAASGEPQFRSSWKRIDGRPIADKMTGVSWREGCPVPLSDLRLLTVSHYDYSGTVKEGSIVVHADVRKEVAEVFRAAFAARFPIAKMRPIWEYDGSDEKSVSDNNTSAFACRPITGKKGGFSKHSYGKAIDINPLTNPYVKGKKVIPKAGANYLDRNRSYTGMIKETSVVYRAFIKRGWKWGGAWKSLKDYQHFEKD